MRGVAGPMGAASHGVAWRGMARGGEARDELIRLERENVAHQLALVRSLDQRARQGAPFLGLLAMVRNECPSYPEWLAHHRAQGVERFYFIDNDSTDIAASSSCRALLRAPDVKVWRWSRLVAKEKDEFVECQGLDAKPYNCSNQVAAYNHFLPRIRSGSDAPEWLGVWDLDEYVFVVNSTVASHLHGLRNDTKQVCMSWLAFGSSGLQAQPKCITKALVRRHRNADWIGKCIQRTAEISSVEVHRSVLLGETYLQRNRRGCICASGAACSYSGSPAAACNRARITDTPDRSVIPSHRIRIHHYKVQSAEHVRQRKREGDVAIKKFVDIRRSDFYWQAQDSNQITDTTLADRATCPQTR